MTAGCGLASSRRSALIGAPRSTVRRTTVNAFRAPSCAPGSLPLDGARGLGGDVVDDAFDALDLVDDPARDLAEQVVEQPRPVGGRVVEARPRPHRECL